jgi:MerR family copper efflux transcriptional regulator
LHQIGEVADAVGLSLRTIRHYEEIGLAPPSGRSAGGFRLYTDEDIDRLRLVKQMKPLEFSLDEMREVLSIRAQLAEDVDAAARVALGERLAMFVAAAEERCARLREQLDGAETLVKMLRREAAPRRARSRR